mmetsp:Transcript_6106/g.13550  ORF Transcript_6106/g.13550 Transcript_6106/m.13550 type:complete len:200 (-) Transcript_6106:344-943(-)
MPSGNRPTLFMPSVLSISSSVWCFSFKYSSEPSSPGIQESSFLAAACGKESSESNISELKYAASSGNLSEPSACVRLVSFLIDACCTYRTRAGPFTARKAHCLCSLPAPRNSVTPSTSPRRSRFTAHNPPRAEFPTRFSTTPLNTTTKFVSKSPPVQIVSPSSKRCPMNSFFRGGSSSSGRDSKVMTLSLSRSYQVSTA